MRIKRNLISKKDKATGYVYLYGQSIDSDADDCPCEFCAKIKLKMAMGLEGPNVTIKLKKT